MDSIADRTGVAIRAYDKRIAELEAEIEKLRLDMHTQEALYSDRIQELEAENAELRNQWQPIETAPLDDTKLLLAWYKKWPDGRWHFEAAPAGNVDIARQGCGSVHGDATHWMPLPEPPEMSDD